MKKKLYKLHDQTMQWLNELEFLQDEQKFLENLLISHFLDLSTPKLYEPTKRVIKKLKDAEKKGDEMYDIIQTHNKHLATLMESIHLNGNKEFKKEHKQIKNNFKIYVLNFKHVKKKIFEMIKEIMKLHKQKLLLEEQ